MDSVLYFDCFSGISGDMTIGALLDLGIDQQGFIEQLEALNLSGYHVEISNKITNGISGTDFNVVLESKEHHHHRSLTAIETIIDESALSTDTKSLAKEIFYLIAHSEARIHGKQVNEIHFHEVGAIDSIVDIVGAAICLEELKPDKIYASPLHLGTGTVTCAHGVFPVPAPATIDILKDTPVYSTGVQGELVTPTGAAIIKTIAIEFMPIPKMSIANIGYGSGKKKFNIPNVLRVLQGEMIETSDSQTDKLILLETNIDDMNPEYYSHIMPLLLEQGALDVYLTNIIMKKGRPGVMLSVLCTPTESAKFEEIIFKETSTLGIRKIPIDRTCLEREIIELQTEHGSIKAKVAIQNGAKIKISPEYEDCRRIAEEKNLPIKVVYEAAITECKNIE